MNETVLEVKNLNLTYSKGGPQVLFDISFAVEKRFFMQLLVQAELENHLLSDVLIN